MQQVWRICRPPGCCWSCRSGDHTLRTTALEKGDPLEGKGNKMKGEEGMSLRDPSGQADHMVGRRPAGPRRGQWAAEPGGGGLDLLKQQAMGTGKGIQGGETGDGIRSKA